MRKEVIFNILLRGLMCPDTWALRMGRPYGRPYGKPPLRSSVITLHWTSPCWPVLSKISKIAGLGEDT